ncbi:MAG: bifunctional DNA primase/polymerase [Gemmatimonadales bacterium]
MSDPAEIIPAYARAGLAVLPLHAARNGRCTCGRAKCGALAKHPLLGHAHAPNDPRRKTCRGECGRLGHGLYDATTDIGTIAEWLARWPWCNWGVRPPVGVVVLDVDPRNGGDTTLLELTRQHGDLPETLTARTGGCGLHIWLTYTGPTRGQLCKGVDIKSHSGYLVAPPSVHVSGGMYEWLNQLSAAYAPRWIKTMLAPPTTPRRRYMVTGGSNSIDRLARWVAKSVEGERNRRLFWAACRAHEAGIDPGPLIDSAESVGLPTMEAFATVRSAANAAPRNGKRAA